MAVVHQSSHLQSSDYNPDTQTLRVTFVDGSIYEYAGVPLDVATKLTNSRGGSAGVAFWSAVRNKYPTTKIFSPRERP